MGGVLTLPISPTHIPVERPHPNPNPDPYPNPDRNPNADPNPGANPSLPLAYA